MDNSTIFLNFLKSLEDNSNKQLLESIRAGFSTLYETPHSETVYGDPLDLHVEDVLNEYGRSEALKYVRLLIQNFSNNRPMQILFTNPGEIDHLDFPKLEISKGRLKDILFRLQKIAVGIPLASLGDSETNARRTLHGYP